MNSNWFRSMAGVGLFVSLTFLSIVVPDRAQAQVPAHVEFTQRELEAAVVLLRPELNSLELDGQKGMFFPAPSIRALGVDPMEFDLDYRGLSELANIQFNHLKGVSPSLRFEGPHLVVQVPVVDQTRAVRSVLGSLSVKGVQLTARLGWRTRASGGQELVVVSTEVAGKITGTGLLKPGFMIGLVKKLLARTLEQTVTRILTREQFTQGIEQGLLGWAKFSSGVTYRSLVPRSIGFFENGSSRGLRYTVE